jgi:hypothetical protein
VKVDDNDFIDCGAGVAGAANAILFNTGLSSGVWITNNRFRSPTGKTQIAIQREGSHTLTPATNKLLGNRFNGLAFAAFQAHENDSGFTDYTPVVEGASTAGVGVYTTQFGRWRRIGNQVFFDVEIVQTSHSGTGLIEISLPVAPLDNANSNQVALTISLSGVATTGGQVGLINPISAAGGVTGCVRCFHTGTGSLTQTAVPAGAATYRVSGTYMAANLT